MKLSLLVAAVAAVWMQNAFGQDDLDDLLGELNDAPAAPAAVQKAAPRTVALVVQDHSNSRAVDILALTDAIAAQLADGGFQVVNPYNSTGANQNRTAAGERTPPTSAIGLARQLGAQGALTATVTDLQQTTKSTGASASFHRFSVRMSFALADARTGGAVCGANISADSPLYTRRQIEQNGSKYIKDLLFDTAAKCARELKDKSAGWRPAPPSPPPPPPQDPAITIDDLDALAAKHIADMRSSPVFIDNYAAAQKAKGAAPLAIVPGIADLTAGKSPAGDIEGMLAACSQTIRMSLVNSRLFDAKDDAAAKKMLDRILASGNSPLEDGKLMETLKQHGTPDFLMTGDMRYFNQNGKHVYRLHLTLHDIRTGKIVWTGIRSIVRRTRKGDGK